MENIINKIKEKSFDLFGSKDIKIIQLKQSGSYRKYFRVSSEARSVIAVYNDNLTENTAFLSFTDHFLSKNLNVPKILERYEDENIYFLEDLGNTTVFDFLRSNPTETEILETYKKILDELLIFQIEGIKGLDTSKCYPRDVFDELSMMWDLNYFKYFTIKLAGINFDELKLEIEFGNLTTFLASADNKYFLYRDFQSKNIMIHNNQLYFIDYQGGRRGAVYYDVASLLFDSKADLSENIIVELVDYSYQISKKYFDIPKDYYLNFFYSFTLIRILQALGAYGFRGIVERKQLFINNIPKALQRVKKLLDNNLISDNYSELKRTLRQLCSSRLSDYFSEISTDLTVSINSFSYLNDGYPKNNHGNGGGFVFDCRFLPNPGRIESCKKLSGLDEEVIEYLEGIEQVETFIADAVKMIVNAAHNYSKMNYTNLQVSFGCTGGQHRSVYCAEKTNVILKNIFNINTNINHLSIKH